MKRSRTVSKTIFLYDGFVLPLASHKYRKNKIYQHVEDPAEDIEGTDVLRDFHIKLCLPGVSGADGDGLEDIQEMGGTNGHTPGHGHSVNV